MSISKLFVKSKDRGLSIITEPDQCFFDVTGPDNESVILVASTIWSAKKTAESHFGADNFSIKHLLGNEQLQANENNEGEENLTSFISTSLGDLKNISEEEASVLIANTNSQIFIKRSD